MKRWFACVLTLCLWIPYVFTVRAEEGTLPSRWLSLSDNTAGARYVVNADGMPFALGGMTLDPQTLPAGEEALSALCTSYRAAGYNSVRFVLSPTDSEGEDRIEACGGYDGTGINAFIDQYVAPSVQTILRSGLYVVLSLRGDPPYDGARERLDFAFERYLPLWVELAKRYAGEPMVAAYELWEEPRLKETDTFDYKEELRTFYIDCTDTIRLYDTAHILIVSSYDGGYGTSFITQWQDAIHRIDSVYHNTAFSIRLTSNELDKAFSYYNQWWASTSAENNVCMIFGEVATDAQRMTAQGMGNLFGMLQDRQETQRYSLFLQTPTGEAVDFRTLFGTYAKEALTLIEDRFWVFEAETAPGDAAGWETASVDGAFGSPGAPNAVRFVDTAVENSRAAIPMDVSLPAGDYEIRVRGLGGEEETATLGFGYITAAGGVLEIGELEGYDIPQPFEQVISVRTADKIVGFLIWKRDSETLCSPWIDRVIVRAAGEVSPEDPSEIPSDLVSGDSSFLDPVSPPTAAPGEQPSGGLAFYWWIAIIGGVVVVLAALVIGVLLWFGRHMPPELLEEETAANETDADPAVGQEEPAEKEIGSSHSKPPVE